MGFLDRKGKQIKTNLTGIGNPLRVLVREYQIRSQRNTGTPNHCRGHGRRYRRSHDHQPQHPGDHLLLFTAISALWSGPLPIFSPWAAAA